jgi:hypothetical protein
VAIIITFFLVYLATWIKEKKSRLRPASTIIVAFLAAYCSSFFFDIIIRWIKGELIFKNIFLSAFVWSGISLTLYSIAKSIATNKFQISIPFYLLSLVAFIAAIRGDFHNIYVAIILVVTGYSTKELKIEY